MVNFHIFGNIQQNLRDMEDKLIKQEYLLQNNWSLQLI